MLSPRRKTILAAAAGFLAFGALALHASPLSAGSMERRLQEAAEAALVRARQDVWARVEMDGQRAILTGLAPSEAERDMALEAVGAAAWAGGVVAGGVTRVIDETRLVQDGAAFALDAHFISGRLSIEGFAPDADGARRLEVFAERLLPERVRVDLRLAPGGAPEAWERAARLMLSELVRLDAGDAVMRGDRLAVTGLAANAQTAESVRQAMNATPPSYVAGALVRAPGGSFSTEITDAALCEAFIDAVLGARPLAFETGSAAITDDASQALRRAGDVFARCRDLALTVAVRAQSDDQPGAELAARRARAVAAALTESADVRARIRARADSYDSRRAIRFEVGPLREAGPQETPDDPGAEIPADPAEQEI